MLVDAPSGKTILRIQSWTFMSVYIANFGRGNWAWPDCLRSSTLVVMDDERVHPFWLRNDRDGYIQEAQKVLRLASGDRKSTRLNSSHRCISYAVFCLK